MMSKPRGVFIVTTMVAVLASSVRAEDSNLPDPRELLKKANEAAARLKAVSYEARFHGEGVVANQVPTMSGRIIAQRGDNPEQPKVRLEGTVAAPGSRNASSVKFATNGARAYRIEESRKLFVSGKAEDAYGPELSALLPPKYFADAPFRMDLAVANITHEGIDEVDGVPCDKVKVVYDPASELAMTYWLGREDHLVRRLENTLRIRVPGHPDPQSGRIIFVASNLNASPEINGETFSLSAPEGYQTETFEPKPLVGANNLLLAGIPAPDWELQTADGRKVSLKDFRGKIVLLDFWASWCGPCKHAMPGLERLHRRFKNDPVEFIGINCRQRGAPLADAQKVIKDLDLTYTQLFEGDKVADSYLVAGLPCMYLIDPEGKVAWAVSGWQPGLNDMTANIITEMLKTVKDEKDK